MKNQKGITLIALVITIIVLLILAAVSISAIVSEDGITNRAQDAKDKTAIATEKEQINLAYSACKAENIDTKEDGIKAPVEVNQMQEEMDRAYGAGAVTVSDSSSGLMVQYANSKRTYMIMQNGKTIADVSAAFKGSANGPIGIAEDGTVVDMSNWQYQYFSYYENDVEYDAYSLSIGGTNFSGGYIGDIVNGRIEGKIPAYILENPERNSEESYKNELLPVAYLHYTFRGKTELVYPPEIPSTVRDLNYAFANCTNLKVAPKLPESAVYLGHAFYECTSLTEAPEISKNVIDMTGTFSDCTNLIKVSSIPASVSYMCRTFDNCINLTGRLEINAKIDTSYKGYYENCFRNTATEDGCDLIIVGNRTNDESIDILFDTKSDNSQITIGN